MDKNTNIKDRSGYQWTTTGPDNKVLKLDAMAGFLGESYESDSDKEDEWSLIEKKLIAFDLRDLDGSESKESDLRLIENQFVKLAEHYRSVKKSDELIALIGKARYVIPHIPKARAAKLVKDLLEIYVTLEHDSDGSRLISVFLEWIDFAKTEKRIHLRQALEIRLVKLYYDYDKLREAIKLAEKLGLELKKQDNHRQYMEVQLWASKTYYALGNLAKARTANAVARSAANLVYVDPKLQAELDINSGMLLADSAHSDYNTAFSYFFEAFEQALLDPMPELELSLRALKYMAVCKLMKGEPEEAIKMVMNNKLQQDITTRSDLKAMVEIAKANLKRSVGELDEAVKNSDLGKDTFIIHQVEILRHIMLDQNICKVLEPYSRIQVEFVAQKMNLPVADVEKKLSQMILDKVIFGTLDQDTGVLILFKRRSAEDMMKDVAELISSNSKIVEILYSKVKSLQ